MRPPRELDGTIRGLIFKLLKLPFGVTLSGIQWDTVVDYWLINYIYMKKVIGVSHLFLIKHRGRSLSIILGKFTYDLSLTGEIRYMEEYFIKISERLKIFKAIIDVPIYINGCDISHNGQGGISKDTTAYITTIYSINITINRLKDANDTARYEYYH